MAHKILTFTCNLALRYCVHPLRCTKMSYLSKSWLRPLVLSGDMLRNRGFILLTIHSFLSSISPDHVSYTDGWIPMTHNDIYDQIRRESTQYPVYITLQPPIQSNNSFKTVQRKMKTESDLQQVKENLNINEKHYNTDTFGDQADKSDLIPLYGTENSRKSKKVPDVYLDNHNIFVLRGKVYKNAIDEKKIKTTTDPIIVEQTTNTYEVSEDSDKFDTGEKEFTEDTGYQYNPPTIENLNLTSKFYKILSKYNIKSDDKLENYDLSLKRKVLNSLTDAFKVPLPYRYNSLNHLPVDPLLAVFLSNYGFYLPSLYGIKTNYNNLYGYLASNNIHNNKPFGLYKIFSDTDSWN